MYKLKNEIKYSTVAQPTCLPVSSYGKSTLYPDENSEAWLVGWGALRYQGSASNKLYNVKITVYNSSFCSRVSPNAKKDWNTQICAGLNINYYFSFMNFKY